MSRSTLRATLVGAAATALVVAGFHALPAAASSTTAESTSVVAPLERRDADTDGKSIFRGVHFFQGDVARQLVKAKIIDVPTEALKRTNTPQAITGVDALIASIEADDPGFFTDLSRDLRSGDPYEVDGALQRSSAHIAERVSLLDDEGLNEGACMVLALAAAVVVVGFGWVVYAADVAVALNRYVAVTQPVEDELTAEEFVADVTPLLATS